MSGMSIATLVEAAKAEGISLGELALRHQMLFSGQSEAQVLATAMSRVEVMRAAVEKGLASQERSASGMVGGDSSKVAARAAQSLTGPRVQKAVAYALAASETNACMGCIVAAPTAGASGIMPGVLLSAAETLEASDEAVAKALLASAAVGAVIARNASVSGAEGGCQAEVGSAAAMAAAAIVDMAGGTAEEAANALAIVLKSALGLVCDPVAGLVEVPCVKRNGVFAASALVAADMALAGVQSAIPPDEVIHMMGEIGRAMPEALRETAKGGLAMTPTGQQVNCKVQGGGDRWKL